MKFKETEERISVTLTEPSEDGKDDASSEDVDHPPPQKVTTVVEVVNTSLYAVNFRKHQRIMERTTRWSIEKNPANQPRITF